MRKLYRSKKDKKISGLCGGLAQWLGMDATVVRLVVAIATFFSFGTIVALYLIASLIIQEEPTYGFDFEDTYYSKF